MITVIAPCVALTIATGESPAGKGKQQQQLWQELY